MSSIFINRVFTPNCKHQPTAASNEDNVAQFLVNIHMHGQVKGLMHPRNHELECSNLCCVCFGMNGTTED